MDILLQILVLSSNTKKGEIERTFIYPSEFCVLDNNTGDIFNMVLSVAGLKRFHLNMLHTKKEKEVC